MNLFQQPISFLVCEIFLKLSLLGNYLGYLLTHYLEEFYLTIHKSIVGSNLSQDLKGFWTLVVIASSDFTIRKNFLSTKCNKNTTFNKTELQQEASH